MRKMVWSVINKSTKRRLLFYFLLLSLIPLITVNLVTYQISSNAITEATVDSAVRSVETALYNMEQVFDEVNSVCKVVNNDANTQQRMRMQFTTRAERFSADLQGGMELASIVGQRSAIFGLYVLGENGGCYKSNMFSFKEQNFSSHTWYQDIISQDAPIWYKTHSGSFVTKTSNQEFISVGVPFVDKASGMKSGVIIADIEESAIIDFVERELSDKGSFILLDENNEIIYQTQQDVLPEGLQENALDQLKKADADQEDSEEKPNTILTPKALIVYQKSPITKWKIVGIIPTDIIYNSVKYIVGLTIAMIMIFGAAAIYISVYLSKKFTNPITKMQESMKNVEEGDLSVSIEPFGEDELADLAKSFNQMVKRIRFLINVVYEKQVLLRKSEYKALEAQINPHFLYNSLDSIIWLLRMNKENEAILMLNNLIVLFRIALSKGNELIAVRKEIQHLESYLIIQSMRYSKKFHYILDIPEELLKYKTLKLLLQPLAENAIYHGLSEEKPKLMIEIKAMKEDGKIIFLVKDNGAGIQPDKLDRLRKALQVEVGSVPEMVNESESYGLRNVDGRIKAYFGNEYGLTINSSVNEGTSIRVMIPQTEGEE